MEQGWIKLHRQLKINPLMNKPNYLAVWIYLLMSANHEQTIVIWNRKNVIIKKGSFIGSLRKISEHFGISIATVKYIIDYFVSEQMIEHSPTKKFSMFTILNWSKYQGIEHPIEHKVKSKLNQSETNKNEENDNNDKKETATNVAGIPEVMHILEEKNPAIKRMYGNPVQRNACERLITRYGLEKVKGYAKFAIKVLGMPYSPRITTPYLLETKWADLEAFYHESIGKQNSKGKEILGL